MIHLKHRLAAFTHFVTQIQLPVFFFDKNVLSLLRSSLSGNNYILLILKTNQSVSPTIGLAFKKYFDQFSTFKSY